jgi:hypothetical protein
MTYQRNCSDIAQVDQKVTKNESPSGTPADPIVCHATRAMMLLDSPLTRQ